MRPASFVVVATAQDGSGTIDLNEFMEMISAKKESKWSSLKNSIMKSHLRVLNGVTLKALRGSYFAEIDDASSW